VLYTSWSYLNWFSEYCSLLSCCLEFLFDLGLIFCLFYNPSPLCTFWTSFLSFEPAYVFAFVLDLFYCLQRSDQKEGVFLVAVHIYLFSGLEEDGNDEKGVTASCFWHRVVL